jgi:hypothetical protein
MADKTCESSGIVLFDGVKRHKANPDTFELYPAAARRSLAVGDFVKLGVELADPGDAPFSSERMWFRVTSVKRKGKRVVYQGRSTTCRSSFTSSCSTAI